MIPNIVVDCNSSKYRQQALLKLVVKKLLHCNKQTNSHHIFQDIINNHGRYSFLEMENFHTRSKSLPVQTIELARIVLKQYHGAAE